MTKQNYTDIQRRMLANLSDDYNKRQEAAIIDTCYDKNFCEMFDIGYADVKIYSKIENILTEFKSQETLE